MQSLFTKIIKACGYDSSLPRSAKNLYGIGHMIHVGTDGFVVKCAGLMVPNPRFDEDTAAGLNPPAEILIQHVIGILTKLPADCVEGGAVPSERSHECIFTLDPSQASMNPDSPVCQSCGQPPTLS